MVCDGKIGKYGGAFDRKRRQKGEYAQVAENPFQFIPAGTKSEIDL